MSDVGKTQLRGHGLRGEGVWRKKRDGVTDTYPHDPEGAAYCSCGAMSKRGISVYAAKKWHREHKDEIRAQDQT